MDKALEVMKSIEKIAEIRFIPSIGPIKGKVLTDIIKKYNPENILEIGALYGYSAILMARGQKDAEITTIEIDKNNFEITKENVKKAGYSDRIKVIYGNAIDALPKHNKKIDLLFLDANKEQYFAYLKLSEKNLKKGSVVVADNVKIFEKNMNDFLDYVRKSGYYKSKTIEVPLEFHEDVYDAMEVSEKL